jgi:hypothetical protein
MRSRATTAAPPRSQIKVFVVDTGGTGFGPATVIVPPGFITVVTIEPTASRIVESVPFGSGAGGPIS